MGRSSLGRGDSGFTGEGDSVRIGDRGGGGGDSNDMRIDDTEPDLILKVGEAALSVEATLATNVSGTAAGVGAGGGAGAGAGVDFPRLERDDDRDGGSRFTASIAFMAIAVVKPRFPILTPDEPYL